MRLSMWQPERNSSQDLWNSIFRVRPSRQVPLLNAALRSPSYSPRRRRSPRRRSARSKRAPRHLDRRRKNPGTGRSLHSKTKKPISASATTATGRRQTPTAVGMAHLLVDELLRQGIRPCSSSMPRDDAETRNPLPRVISSTTFWATSATLISQPSRCQQARVGTGRDRDPWIGDLCRGSRSFAIASIRLDIWADVLDLREAVCEVAVPLGPVAMFRGRVAADEYVSLKTPMVLFPR